MTDYLLLYSGGSMPGTEEEQKTVWMPATRSSARIHSTQRSA
ncbi:MAG TPA: hypothetical protein VI364_05600 [Actinomycetota bacterium]